MKPTTKARRTADIRVLDDSSQACAALNRFVSSHPNSFNFVLEHNDLVPNPAA